MKKVVLLGDSIRLIGYGNAVENKLSADFTVWQPNDNCRFAQYTLRGLYDWRNQIENCDIIHWNNGHWDICDLFGDGPFTSIEEYVKQMVRIAKLLQQRSKIVIFATTTPVRKNYMSHSNNDIRSYNEALVTELKKMGIVINDLYALVSQDVDRYIREDDKIHLSDEGIAVCAAQVERVIREQAVNL